MKGIIHDIIGSIRLPHSSDFTSSLVKSCKIEAISGEMYLCKEEDIDFLNLSNDSLSEIEQKLFKTNTLGELLSVVNYTQNIDYRHLTENFDIKKLLKWCRKYSVLPYSSNNCPIDLFKLQVSQSINFENLTEEEFTIFDKWSGRFGVHLQSLYEEVFTLASLYNSWLITLGVNSDILKTKSIVNAPKDIENLFYHINSQSFRKDNLWYTIEFIFNLILKPQSSYSLKQTRSGLKIENSANSVMDLFFLNTAILMTNNNIKNGSDNITESGSIVNNKIRTCKYPGCGKEFWPLGKEQYCLEHNRKNASYKKNSEVWKARKQARKQSTSNN
jgi:hypothetical protein